MRVTVDDLRRYAVTRSLFAPTSLVGALEAFGFVQADPIRAPARAQDLMLRHRVDGYRAGDLERHYAALPIEEDVFINYGFVTRRVYALMHPRTRSRPRVRGKRVAAILEFVRSRGAVHPRDVDARFAHGTVTNYWGGSSAATTHMLDAMHYDGWLRIARREGGIRIYAPREAEWQAPGDRRERDRRIDALVDAVVRKYAPLPGASFAMVIARLRYAVPQWRAHLKPALQRARQRFAHTRIDGIDWYWPDDESVAGDEASDSVRLLAPFDPIVWDRRRFEMLWGWPYRFEAYTPVAKRKLGYYALPLLWRDRVIGWGNVSVVDGVMRADIGYVSGRRPRHKSFAGELDAELARLRRFL